MSSSKSASQPLVHVRSCSGPIEITLLNGSLDIVATGYGELRRRVSPGIYMLRFDTGIKEVEEFITVDHGQDYKDLEVSLPIISAAPLAGTAGFDERQCDAVSRLSREPARHSHPGGRFILFVRNRVNHRSEQINLASIDLRNAAREVVCLPEEAVERDLESGWAGLSMDVEPGGYALRWHNKWHSRWAKSGEATEYVDQSLWVHPGWTTTLFLMTNPLRDNQPRMTGMTVHMRRMETGFESAGESGAERVNQVCQLALNSLLSGESFVPTDIVALLEDGRHCNPMLGILGAHALLQENSPRWSYFDLIVRQLFKLVPGHPDAVALRLIGKQRRRDKTQTRSEAVVWPPMVFEAYRGLVERDWAEGGLIAPRSKAERVATRLLPQGPWTVWASTQRALEEADVSTPRALPEVTEVDEILKEVQHGLRSSTLTTLEDQAGEDIASGSMQSIDPATYQVADFLGSIQEQMARFDAHNVAQQIAKVGLPVSSVVRALNQIKGIKS